MNLGALLDLAALLDRYALHARERGYHRAADWAAALQDIVTSELRFLEHQTYKTEKQ